VPATLGLLAALAAAALIAQAWRWRRGDADGWTSTLLWTIGAPALAAAALLGLKPASLLGQAAATLLVVTPLGPLVWRLVYRPLAHASVLTLLIASVALHGVFVGLGLIFFGSEGSRTPAFYEARFDAGGVAVGGQSLVVVGVTLALVAALYLFFERSIAGKALRATAMNRVGAQLMGIPIELAGDLSFALAALIGAVSGLLIAPLATIYYDTGFLIGLKGFVAAIVGGLASYPLALLGALLVGQIEAYASFWASPFKEVLVFTLIIPVLWWRSLRSRHVEEED
jgi:branched-chain amino acid transport system permease protein